MSHGDARLGTEAAQSSSSPQPRRSWARQYLFVAATLPDDGHKSVATSISQVCRSGQAAFPWHGTLLCRAKLGHRRCFWSVKQGMGGRQKILHMPILACKDARFWLPMLLISQTRHERQAGDLHMPISACEGA